jgi:titin
MAFVYTPPAPPPSNFGVICITPNEAYITWNPPAPIDSSGVEQVTKYTIYYSTGTNNNFIEVSKYDTSYNLTNLGGGQYYTFYMNATNSLQIPSTNTQSITILILQKQPPPENFDVSANVANQAYVSWTPPTQILDSSNGGPVIKYTIYYNYDGIYENIDISANKTFHNFTNLNGGEFYNFYMTASNNISESNPTNSIYVNIIPEIQPPTDLSGVSSYENQVSLTWTLAEPQFGTPLSYIIYYYSDDVSGNIDVSANINSYIVTNLSGGKLYNFYLVSKNSLNEVSVPSGTISVNVFEAQGPPINVSVSSTQINNAFISWNPAVSVNSGNLQKYTIYYYLSNNVNQIFTQDVSLNDTSYNLNNLIGGQEYFFSMTATNNYNESIQTSPISQIILSQQLPPSDLSGVSIVSKQVIISWTQAEELLGSPILKYTIYYYLNTNPSLIFQQDISANYSTATISGLLNDKIYVFYMTASNMHNTSEETSRINIQLPESMAAPTITSASSNNINQLSITWLGPTLINNLPILYYTIYGDDITDPLNIILGAFESQIDPGFLSYTLTNLTGYTYRVYITATNSYGVSEPSQTQNIIIMQGQGPPLNVIISSISNTIKVDWNAAVTASTGALQKYTIYYYVGDNSNNITSIDVSANITTYTISGLTLFSNYKVYMTATNTFNTSINQYSTPPNITLYPQQTPPTDVSGTSTIYNEANITWTLASEVNGLGPIQKYTIYYQDNDSDNSNNIYTIDVSSNITSYNFNNLIGGHTYNFKINATNSFNTSNFTTPINLTIIQRQTPPNNVSLASNNYNTATLTWQPAESVYNSSVNKYTIYYYTIDNSNNLYSRDVSSNSTSYSFTNLVGGDIYGFKMSASNSNNESILVNSNPSTIRILQRQTPPENVDVSFTILNEVNITWTPAQNVYSGDVIKYTINYFTQDSPTNITHIDVSANITSLLVNNLIGDKIYNFTMTASNSYSTSIQTSNVTIINQFVPLKPINFSGICENPGEITLFWNPPLLEIPGYPITKYTIYYYSNDNSNNLVTINNIGSGLTSYIVSQLQNQTTYNFYMTSSNIIGESTPTNIISIGTTIIYPVPTRVLAVSNEVNKATIHWRRPNNLDSFVLSKYTIYYYKNDNSGNLLYQDVNLPAYSYTLDLSGGETYSFYMTAWYDSNSKQSDISNISSVKILSSIPPPVSNICFPSKTPIRTDQGLIHIDKINPEFHTIHKKKIVAITQSITQDEHLVCFEKDSIAANIPSQQTMISPNHKILYNGKMIKAKKFVGNLKNVHNIFYNGEILYNVLMEDLDKMMVNNLIAETLDPNNSIAKLYTIYNFNNLDDYNKIQLINNFNKYVKENKIYSSSLKK